MKPASFCSSGHRLPVAEVRTGAPEDSEPRAKTFPRTETDPETASRHPVGGGPALRRQPLTSTSPRSIKRPKRADQRLIDRLFQKSAAQTTPDTRNEKSPGKPELFRCFWTASDNLKRELGAQERTRTSTPIRALAPEASASTSSATWAVRAACKGRAQACQSLPATFFAHSQGALHTWDAKVYETGVR